MTALTRSPWKFVRTLPRRSVFSCDQRSRFNFTATRFLPWSHASPSRLTRERDQLGGVFVRAGYAERKIVCYYTNWSIYRPGTAKFSPQNINPYLCTHLIYAFGGFTKDNALKPFDKYQDIEKGRREHPNPWRKLDLFKHPINLPRLPKVVTPSSPA